VTTAPQRLYIGTSVVDDARGGWAAVIETGAGRHTLAGRADVASVDDLGLRALLAALAALPVAAPLHVVTANQRLRDGLTGQLATWARDGWRTSAGREIRNRELWARVHALTVVRPLAGASTPGAIDRPLADQARKLAAHAALSAPR